MKIYTRTGDEGTTALRTGVRVSKADPRIRANGAIDEANAILGVVLAAGLSERIRSVVAPLQNDLFTLGADISNPDMINKTTRITQSMIRNLESTIDLAESDLPPLTNFILPGGHMPGALLHVARAAVRRAESHITQIAGPVNPECLKYVNRLSDLLFVMARLENHDAGAPETIWAP